MVKEEFAYCDGRLESVVYVQSEGNIIVSRAHTGKENVKYPYGNNIKMKFCGGSRSYKSLNGTTPTQVKRGQGKDSTEKLRKSNGGGGSKVGGLSLGPERGRSFHRKLEKRHSRAAMQQ